MKHISFGKAGGTKGLISSTRERKIDFLRTLEASVILECSKFHGIYRGWMRLYAS